MSSVAATTTRLSGPAGSEAVAFVPAPPSPRKRARVTLGDVELSRGAPREMLDRPAAELLEAIPWEGTAPDPDVLDAATFLAWL